jgi:uncharacterized protein YegP (UPF0339 family)
MSKKSIKFETYKARDGFRWRARASNNKIMADSGESYVTLANATRALSRFIALVRAMPES